MFSGLTSRWTMPCACAAASAAATSCAMATASSLYIAASIALATRDTTVAARRFDAVLREDGYYSKPAIGSRAPLLELAGIGSLVESRPRGSNMPACCAGSP